MICFSFLLLDELVEWTDSSQPPGGVLETVLERFCETGLCWADADADFGRWRSASFIGRMFPALCVLTSRGLNWSASDMGGEWMKLVGLACPADRDGDRSVLTRDIDIAGCEKTFCEKTFCGLFGIRWGGTERATVTELVRWTVATWGGASALGGDLTGPGGVWTCEGMARSRCCCVTGAIFNEDRLPREEAAVDWLISALLWSPDPGLASFRGSCCGTWPALCSLVALSNWTGRSVALSLLATPDVARFPLDIADIECILVTGRPSSWRDTPSLWRVDPWPLVPLFTLASSLACNQV